MSGDVREEIGYSPPLSLWKLVEQHVAAHEQEEIKSMLGGGVVDETLELHDELQAFLEIWRECRQNKNMPERQSQSVRLPEPPGMRDRLVQEIKFFLDNVREKAQEQGRDEAGVMRKYNQNVIDYAANNESRSSSCDLFIRPQSVIGRDGRETPVCRHESPFSDRISMSTYSSLSEDVEAMADKLNVLKLDEVVQHLRSYLAEEREWLVQDLRFLQQCIEEENEIGATMTPNIPEPTIGELREERLKLEKDMLSDAFTHQKSLHTSLRSLKSSSAKTRAPIVPVKGPLKAVHLTAPDGIVLAGNVPGSVVVKAQQKLKEHQSQEHDSYLVQVANINSNQVAEGLPGLSSNERSVNLPKLSTSSARPSSAKKFRSMILSARSVTSE